MVDVFVSYAREDQAFAQRIAHAAAREGYDVWWDDDLPPHLSYGEVITEKIGNAKAAIVVWSHRSAESEWVRAEADLARSQKKLIQTSIDDRQPPMPFNQIQFASIGDWNGEPDHPGWKKVRASLAALCGGAAWRCGREEAHRPRGIARNVFLGLRQRGRRKAERETCHEYRRTGTAGKSMLLAVTVTP